jgi:hypothetical protein
VSEKGLLVAVFILRSKIKHCLAVAAGIAGASKRVQPTLSGRRLVLAKNVAFEPDVMFFRQPRILGEGGDKGARAARKAGPRADRNSVSRLTTALRP